MAKFQKGQSGNPKGRPKKGSAFSDILNYKLDQKTADGKLRREIVSEKIIELAEAGDVAAIRYLMDRTDGKPTETVNANLTGNVVDMDAIMKKLESSL